MELKPNNILVAATAFMLLIVVIMFTRSCNSGLTKENNELKVEIKRLQQQEKEYEVFVEELYGRISEKQDSVDLLMDTVSKYKVGSGIKNKGKITKKYEETFNRTRNLSVDSTFQLLLRNIGR